MLSKKQSVVIAILLGASLAVGWVDGESFRDSPHHEKKDSANQRPYTKAAEIRPDERIANYTWWLAILTGALVAASLGQGCFLLRADKTARTTAIAALKSADVAEKALVAAYAPLITITELELRDANDLAAKPHLHFGMRNSGGGIAIVNRVGVSIQFREQIGLRISRATSFTEHAFNGAIEARESSTGHTVTTDTLRTRIGDIRNGRIGMFVNFEIVGQDRFHNASRQNFPFNYNHLRAAFERAPVSWQNDPETES